MDKTDFAWSQAALSGGAALYAGDEELRDAALSALPNTKTLLLKVGEHYGEAWTGAGLAVGLYAAGLLAGDHWSRETGRQLLTSLVVGGAITSVIKSVSGRSRPHLNEGPNMFRPLRFDAGHTAFPSGHATVAFAVSTVLAKRIDNPFAAAALYLLAGLTAVQRTSSDSHWGSDVFLGAIIGYACAAAVSDNSRAAKPDQTLDLGIRMLSTPGGDTCPSLTGRFRFP